MKSYKSFSVAELEDAKGWDLPHVDEQDTIDDGKTNALNRRSDWKYEPPEEPEEIKPPTAEEIEAIRQRGMAKASKPVTMKAKPKVRLKGMRKDWPVAIRPDLSRALSKVRPKLLSKPNYGSRW